MAKVLYMFNQMPLLFSGQNVAITHRPPIKLQASDSADYGKYLAASCVGCHNPSYTGGKILDQKFMPWQATAAMSDMELKALYTFLKTL